MFRKLLVPLDRSPLAEQALGAAATIARASAAKIALLMVHQPVPYAGFKDAPWKAAQATSEEKYLATIAAELESGASISTTHQLLVGDVVETICEHAKDIGADLIVMTSHGRTGFSRVWHGSVADGVLRDATLPVLMLPVAMKYDHATTTSDVLMMEPGIQLWSAILGMPRPMNSPTRKRPTRVPASIVVRMNSASNMIAKWYQ